MSFFSIIGPNLCHSFALQVPASTEDSDFEGPETDMYVLCHGHGKQQKGMLLSKGFTLAGGFFVVQRRYGFS